MNAKMHSLAELEAQAFVGASHGMPVVQPEAGFEIVATATSVAVIDPLPEPVVDEASRLETEAYDRFDAALLAAAASVPSFKGPEDLVEHVRTTVLTSVNTEEMIANLAAAAAAFLDTAKSPARLAVISGRENNMIQDSLASMKAERDDAFTEIHFLKKEVESMQNNPPIHWPVRVGHNATNVLKRDKGVWGKFSAAVATEESLVDFFIKDLALRHDLTKAISNERRSSILAEAVVKENKRLKAAAPVGEPSVMAARDAETIRMQEQRINALTQQLREVQKGSQEGAIVDTDAVDRLSALIAAQDKQIVSLKEEIIAHQKGVATGTVAELKALAAAIRGAARFNVPGITPELLIQAVEKL